jgi:hypothetical protein
MYRQSGRPGVKALKAYDQENFSTEPLRLWSLRNILSDERMGLSLTNMLGFSQVYVSHM